MTGTTMYSITERISVPQNTVVDGRPSDKPVTGANAATIIVSFKAIWLRVGYGLPSIKFNHTNTIAMHGRSQQDQPGDVAVPLASRQ